MSLSRTVPSVAATLLLAAFAWLSVHAETREWSDRSGQFKITAEYQSYADGKVTLLRADGRTATVPLAQLSAADQQWIRERIKAERTTKAPAKSVGPREVATPVSAAGPWPQWRGPARDGLSPEKGLLTSWPQAPPLLWSARDLGGGHASVAVTADRIYTLGDRRGGCHLIALDKSGKEIWATRVGPGSPNSTPTVDGDLIFALGREGDLVCVQGADGAEVWRKNFGRDFGGQMMSGWGYSESPLVDGDRLLCTPGSQQAMIAALDKRTGRPLWTSPMPPNAGGRGKDGAGYASIVISNAGGVKQYVQLVGRGMISVAAADGKLLWGYNRVANDTANIPTPLVKGDFIFCSTGYGTGAALLRVGPNAAAVQEVYFLDANKFQNHHGGMILLGDYVYCGHGHNQGFPMCIELATGRPMWSAGRGPGSGSAAVTYADGHLYFRYEDGTMALIEANPREFKLKGSFRIASVHDKSWSAPVVADGKLYLRDQHELHCYDVRAQ